MAASEPKIHIIGMGDDGLDGLTSPARKIIEQAEVLVGGDAALKALPKSAAQRIAIGADLDDAISQVAKVKGKRIVVLASGDPLFYGVARYLCDRLGKDRFEVVPHVSSMQLAFARVKESWEEAYLTNLANHRLDEVIEKIRIATKVGLFTTEATPTKAVAKALLDRRIDYFSAYVCENLGSPDERVTQGELAEIAAQDFSPLNVMILVRRPDVPDRPRDAIGQRLFGNPDEAFLQSKPKHGLLTPAEVRAIALAEMDLGPTSMVWDIGAGSGSVAIEAAQISAGGTVYAIEMDAEDHELISRQRRALRRGEPGGGPRPRARRLGGTARSRQRFCGRQRARDQRHRRIGLPAAAARRPAGGQCGQHRESVGRARVAGQIGRRRQGVDDQPRPRHLSARASAVRSDEPDVPVERGQAGRQRRQEIRGKASQVSASEYPQLDVIAVGAHPDDVEIACGGTLALLVQQGYQVGIVDLTDGEPTPGSPGPEVRLAEAQRAAEMLGVHVRVQLNLPNRRLFDTFEARVALGKEFRKYRPRLVLGFGEKTPLASPDHWQAMQITDAAVFYARLTKWDEYFD